jgi:hypothetical protein
MLVRAGGGFRMDGCPGRFLIGAQRGGCRVEHINLAAGIAMIDPVTQFRGGHFFGHRGSPHLKRQRTIVENRSPALVAADEGM